MVMICGCGGGGEGSHSTTNPSGTGAVEGYIYVPQSTLASASTRSISPMLAISNTPPLGYIALVGADITVKINGQSLKTKTDSTGHFKVSNLPAGTAKVTITPPLIGNTGLGEFLTFTTTMEIKNKTIAYIGNSGSISLVSHSADYLNVIINQIDSTRSPILNIYVSVIDPVRNTPIIGLSRQNFEVKVTDSNAVVTNVQQVESFSAPTSVCLVLDRSGSMDGQPLIDLRSAAKQFISYIGPNDRAEIVSFSDSPTVNCSFTNDKNQLDSAIDQLVSNGATALYDATGQGINDIIHEPNNRKAIVVMTDGGENNSSNFDLDRVINEAKSSGIPIYTIGLAGWDFTNSNTTLAAKKSLEHPTINLIKTKSASAGAEQDLQRLAQETGGEYFYAPDSSDLMGIYTKISQRQQQMYVLTITDPIPQNNEKTLKVTVNACGLTGAGAGNYRFHRFDYSVNSSLYIPGSYAGRSFYYDGVHLGEDIKLDESTPVKAIGDGKIVFYKSASGYGELCCVIEHDLGKQVTLDLNVGDTKQRTVDHICSIYGHIRKNQNRDGLELPLKVGNIVSKGQIIGYVNDGDHNGDGGVHLHMGIRLTPYDGYFYGYSHPEQYPQSDVKYFAAFSEVIYQLQ